MNEVEFVFANIVDEINFRLFDIERGNFIKSTDTIELDYYTVNYSRELIEEVKDGDFIKILSKFKVSVQHIDDIILEYEIDAKEKRMTGNCKNPMLCSFLINKLDFYREELFRSS